jgi:hypothetical protein
MTSLGRGFLEVQALYRWTMMCTTQNHSFVDAVAPLNMPDTEHHLFQISTPSRPLVQEARAGRMLASWSGLRQWSRPHAALVWALIVYTYRVSVRQSQVEIPCHE